jgi:rhodanese-related sulfurtransferase
MGPLVPNIIGFELNLIIALFIGFSFGFILEQAGFSSSRKLVGLFYGYDFTVLRVFFTAGITAMIGIIIFNHVGLIDVSLLYINPTYLWAALVGGGIMGLGFLAGGFCPGTSVCAASIGRTDAMLFILGAVLGIFLFGELFHIFEPLYLAKDLGPVRIDEFLGISAKLFAAIMSLMAVAAFYFTRRIENKVNNLQAKYASSTKRNYMILAALPFFFILLTVIFPSKEQYIQNRIEDAKRQKECNFHTISVDKLAIELTNNYQKINLIDVRPSEEYKESHIPLAINIPLGNFFERRYRNYFKQNYKTNIFYADADTIAKMACLSAKFMGRSENKILDGSTNDFISTVFEPQRPDSTATKREYNMYEFYRETAVKLNKLQTIMSKFDKPVIKQAKPAAGGC